ncbi:MAG: HNH endonuclease [Lysobacterales bacterium]|nr:MAG: HNH endonuclease [Xanthomonadales bacterium]
MKDVFVKRDELARLGEQITELAGHLNAGEYRFLALVEVFDREGGWQGEGIHSCAHWLNWRCGLSLGVAREKVRVARALPELPQISKAFRQGRVSYSKVRAMTRVANPKNEPMLLNVALHGTAYHVETQVRLYRQVKRREALEQENHRHAHRELSWHVDESGYWVFRGRLTAEQGAMIAKALEASMDRSFEERRGEPEAVEEELHRNACISGFSEPVGQRRADALERVARAYLAGPEAAGSAGDRYLVNVHTDIETLKADGDHAEANLDDRSDVPAETSRRLACDASLLHWLENGDGEPLSVGRKTRSIPPAIRRALQRRDGGCRFPGCCARRFVDAHHIHHWADGGETRMDNLVLLCRRHHRLVHEGGFGLAIGPDRQFRFSEPNGTPLPNAPNGRSRGNVDAICSANTADGLHITARTAVPDWWGERMDHQLAVLELIQWE